MLSGVGLRALFVCALTGAAWGSNLQVSPIRLDTDEKTRTTLLTVRNVGRERMRLQASAAAWTQDEHGEMVLQPTREVAYFPSMLELAPGESRQIRIGTTAGSGTHEKTYRVTVEQLPSLEAEQPGIHLLMKTSVP